MGPTVIRLRGSTAQIAASRERRPLPIFGPQKNPVIRTFYDGTEGGLIVAGRHRKRIQLAQLGHGPFPKLVDRPGATFENLPVGSASDFRGVS
jgi:hypothetical protein